MKLQQILHNLQRLHPKEIDLNLDRINKLCKKLGNPQDSLKYISVIGTNGKYSTIQAIRAILKEANINCNVYTSPHIQKVNERYEYNNCEINDEELDLGEETDDEAILSPVDDGEGHRFSRWTSNGATKPLGLDDRPK